MGSCCAEGIRASMTLISSSYVYFENYISTYVERDVSEYVDARSKGPFRRLLMLCAQSCGSLLNVSRLASDLGVARATIDS